MVTDVDRPEDPEFFRKLVTDEALSSDGTAGDGARDGQQNGATTYGPCLTVAAWLSQYSGP